YRARHHAAPVADADPPRVVDTPHLIWVAPYGRSAPRLRSPAAGARSAPEAPCAPPLICTQTLPREEPLADPVWAPPRPVAAPAPRPAPVPVRPQPAADPWHHHHDADGACLQLPLPMAATHPAAPLALSCTPAPPWLRLRAARSDAAVVLAASLVFAVTAWVSLGFPALRLTLIKPWLPALVGVPLLLAAIYLLLCAYAGGPTLGMQRWGLDVVALDGPLTPPLRRGRGWACLLSLAPLGLGFIWMFCDPQGLGWHDILSRTCVIEVPNPSS
ncbi:MAG TPA: RDD family protein, partial [Terriglobales bacterium]